MLPTTWRLFTSTEDAWSAMLESCREAKVSIDLEQYIFHSDTLGIQFIEIFKEKIKEGVRVRLLLDTSGSYGFYNSSLPAELRKLGIEVRFFNIISPWRIHNIFSWFFRDHRKILIIDKRIGFTGGVGIGEYMREWRDTSAQVEGSVVGEMSGAFEEMWTGSLDHGFFHRMKKMKAYLRGRQFITSSPYFKKRFLYYVLMEGLRSASEKIFITVPYFIPDRRLMRILRLAVRRGVDVRVILPEKNDVPIVNLGAHSSFEMLLKNGIRIFKYTPRVLHAKTIIVDKGWATYGSFNLDSLSFRYNYEANVVTTDPSCVDELTEHFSADLKDSKEITLEEWEKRPFTERVKEFFVVPIRGFL